jgi:hypothetical protein
MEFAAKHASADGGQQARGHHYKVYPAASLQQAVADKTMSPGAAAREYGVPEETIRTHRKKEEKRETVEDHRKCA